VPSERCSIEEQSIEYCVACCPVTGTGWSLFHERLTESYVYECDCEASTKRRLLPTRRRCTMGEKSSFVKKKSKFDCYSAVRWLADILQAKTKLRSRLLVQKRLHRFVVHGPPFSGFKGLLRSRHVVGNLEQGISPSYCLLLKIHTHAYIYALASIGMSFTSLGSTALVQKCRARSKLLKRVRVPFRLSPTQNKQAGN
jgi:hypothetical protein